MGKSSILGAVTDTKSECAAYEFTTLTCIPGNLVINETKIQMLDLPGIIEGAASGKGRGKEVIAVARSSDIVMMVLDGARESNNQHRNILTRELETMGIRLNQSPPDIYFKVIFCTAHHYHTAFHRSYDFRIFRKKLVEELSSMPHVP